ncbi:DUF6483 family protein [Paenibacillus pasadenensis]|uniref:DUF6483 family protein n=1 Tax=Paenibacillus pasadenensis TaxID=217090 RepID=UPI00203DE061|nr:DUF6483 family protein [Paenibacillus pasadenensis]MCM3748306.1 DUF6483 family protein [Paenibacillus pasadenensis]
MFQRDYFMRMIEQMAEVSAAILGLKKAGKQEEALQVIEELLDKHFRMNARLLKGLSDEDLVRMMSRSGVPDASMLHALALLVKEEADLHEESGREGLAFQSRLKSLHLLLRVSSLGAEPSPDDTIREQLRRLAAYELPPATKRLLACWREEQGEYAMAEDLWHELLEDGELEPAEMGEFYRRLLPLEEAALTAGGLSRSEVREAAEPWVSGGASLASSANNRLD